MSTHSIIFEAVHGSRAFGLDTADSDVDVRGIIVGPIEWYSGFLESPEQIEISSEHVLYDIRKFFRLAAAANPTALEILWVDAGHHRLLTRAGRRLLASRELFLSRRVEDTFSGYALSQLRRIRGHRRWLLHPPKQKPTRSEFGLPEQTLVSRDQLGAAEALIARGSLREAELTPNFLALMDRERHYRTAKRQWDQYQTWLRNRNPARAALEAKFGYDTKHAQHLVRLLRKDREELLAIRRGALPYDKLIEFVESLEGDVKNAAMRCSLPTEPNEKTLNALCAEIVELVINER